MKSFQIKVPFIEIQVISVKIITEIIEISFIFHFFLSCLRRLFTTAQLFSRFLIFFKLSLQNLKLLCYLLLSVALLLQLFKNHLLNLLIL